MVAIAHYSIRGLRNKVALTLTSSFHLKARLPLTTAAARCSLHAQACGGLIVASVIKYLDAIAKNFATAVSMVVVSVLSALTMDTTVTIEFVAGLIAVNIACFLYSSNQTTKALLPTTAASDSVKVTQQAAPGSN